jgi:hypothetical protein
LKKLNRLKVEDVVVSGIDLKDAPDFSDAFISEAKYEGRPLTEDEIEELNEDSSFVHEQVMGTVLTWFK